MSTTSLDLADVVPGVRFVAPAAVLGGGFSRRSFQDALESRPEFIACDAGSADWGPYYLGSATSWAGYHQTRRDLEPMILGAAEVGAKLLIGSAGFSGSEDALLAFRDLVLDILRDHGMSRIVAVIHSEQPLERIAGEVARGHVHPLDGRPELTVGDVAATTRIVAMMGPEPFAAALSLGADIVVAGRSSDAALYAAYPLWVGVPEAPAWHMGKIVECGSAIADPISAGESIVGTVGAGGFAVRPVGGRSRCTVASVAAQMLYENASPFVLREPPGTLDTSGATYRQVDEFSVAVEGASFRAERYSVRLEGVSQLGHRSICLFGVRDPAVIRELDRYTREISALVDKTAEQRYGLAPGQFTFGFRRYGYDAVLGELEPMRRSSSPACYEVGLVAEAMAPSQELAHELLSGALPYIVHGVRVPGTANSASAALAYAPCVIDTGAVFDWTVWHALELNDPLAPFPIDLVTVRDGEVR